MKTDLVELRKLLKAMLPSASTLNEKTGMALLLNCCDELEATRAQLATARALAMEEAAREAEESQELAQERYGLATDIRALAPRPSDLVILSRKDALSLSVSMGTPGLDLRTDEIIAYDNLNRALYGP